MRKKKGYIIPFNEYNDSIDKTQLSSLISKPKRKLTPNEENKSNSVKGSINKDILLNNERDQKKTALKTNIEISKINKPKKPNLQNPISSFSLSSIAIKKAAKNVTKKREEETHKPKDDFDFNLLEKIWKEYTLGLKKEGKKNIASILDMNKISLKDSNKILYSVSSEMHKVEINLEMKNLLPFLRERLNNHDITVELVVLKRNKEESIYSPTEKYQYLKKINPLLDELKSKFDLNF